MRLFIVLFFFMMTSNSWADAAGRFRGEKISIIDWENNTTTQWTDLSQWKRELEVKKMIPDWEHNLREIGRTEPVARVMDCSGDCRVYRGLGFARVQYLSTVYEGDEISTNDNGYLWLYLFDGTMVRLSPQTSVSIQEVNVSPDEIFYFVRLNTGNLLWLSRGQSQFTPNPLKETDVLYFPMKMYEANNSEEIIPKIDEENLFALIEEKSVSMLQYERLNKKMEERKENKFKPVYTFLVLPNGTLFGKNLAVEAVVLTGAESFFKLRSPEQLSQKEAQFNEEVSLYYRGFENREESSPPIGKWCQFDPKGRSFQEFPLENIFAMGEFVTSNIPTIYLTRELMMDRYGTFLHQDLSKEVFATDYSYRLWTPLSADKSELKQRVAFLKEFTRRIETTNLLSAEKLSKRLEERGEKVSALEYGPRFYEKAMNRYHIYKESLQLVNTDREPLNSEKKPFWKIINVYK